MRIIHTDTDDIENPLRGGQPVRTFEVSSRLSKNHQIHVLTASYKGSVPALKRGEIQYQRLGVTIPKWGLSSHLSYLARLPAAIKKIPHDLVVEEFTPPFGFCNLQRYTQKPVISMVQWHFFKDWEKRYKLPFEAIMQQRAVKYQHRDIIVQTNKMADSFKVLLPNANIVKIPCGINQEAFHVAQSEGDYVLYLGRLDIKHKGLDDLFLAWKMLKVSGVEIPLWIVGTGQDEFTLKQTAKNFGIDHLLLFKGRLEGDEKQIALQNCRFMVMPSRQETFGITALEAMASSKPVVAYDIDHLNELLRLDWSSLAPLGNVAVLAESVAGLWKSPQACVEKGKLAYVAAQTYLWDNIAKQQEEFYLSVIKQRQQ